MSSIRTRRLKKAPEEATVLALECSAGLASAAVMRDGDVLAMAEHAADHGHVAWLLPLAAEALGAAGVERRELDAVLAGRGPGSFTGIRVALAAAKGLALALGIPGYGLGSLASLAVSGRDGRRHVAALGDTRRRSLFVAGFTPDGASLGPIADLSVDAATTHLAAAAKDWIIIGHGAAELASRLEAIGVAASVSPPSEAHATHLLKSFALMADVLPSDLPLEPLYLAPPILGPSTGAAKEEKKG
ncbi:tRNA (adenosine(37)-N6)-threonylcarbamoyltransferase complex dimerization subunit type 1 TsaB [Alphaproteobacteria bacterium LSUCC0684]